MNTIYIVLYSTQAKKSLDKIPSFIAERIVAKIKLLPTEPYLGVKMNGDISSSRKIKVSNYRVIYQIFEAKVFIEILEIESRGNVSYDR